MITAAIVGGGIGGLSAAIALHKVGVEAHVYEQAPQLEEIGAGLAVWANGVRALHHLGLAPHLASVTTPIHVTGTRTASNPRIDLVDLRRVHEDLGVASVAMHRGELLQILLDAVDARAIHTNKRVRDVEQSPDHVTAHFADGTSVSADILVAADGISSSVRQLLTEVTPSYAGYSAYRSVVNDFDLGSEWPRHGIVRTLSCGEYFGLGEITPRRYLWFLTKNRPLHGPEPGGRKSTVMRTVASWAPPISSFVEATPEEDILLHPIYKLWPLKTWRFGRVVLLGDAAHPIQPALGMGASLAIEDAVVLARSFAETLNHGDAFRRYEQHRMPRVRKLVRWAAVLARSEQMTNPLLCRTRDISTRLTPESTTLLLARRAFDFSIPAAE